MNVTKGKCEALPREFYQRDANLVAPELLGKLLVSQRPEGRTAGMIVEVEAYKGSCDKGAHSYRNKRTERTKIQFGPGGFAYVFRIYGLHSCFNVVTNQEEVPDVVLVRALEPVEGLALMEQRRLCGDPARLCNGPGKLCQALNFTGADYGESLQGPRLCITPYRQIEKCEIMVSPRINIDYAEECADYPWRYYIKNSPWVSDVPGKYRAKATPFSLEGMNKAGQEL